MTNSVITQWLQTECSLLQNAFAGSICPDHQHPNQIVHLNQSEIKTSKTALTATMGLAIEHNRPIIKPFNPQTAEEQTTLAIALPLKLSTRISGSVAFLLKGDDTNTGKKALLQLQQGIPWLFHLLRNNNSDCVKSHNQLGKITRLIAAALAPERFSEAASTLTTELSAELDCEHVYLGLMHSRKTKLESISKTSTLARREPLPIAIVEAMDEANDQMRSICYPSDNPEPAIISRAHEDLAQRFNLGAVCSVPLIMDQKIIGTLILERKNGRTFTLEEQELYEQIGNFLAPILKMKYRTGQTFLLRMGERMSRWRRWTFSQKGLGWKTIFITMAMVITALGIIPVPYEITSPSQLEGSIQRAITAPGDGYIKQVHVRPGDNIKKDQILIELDDRDLLLEKEKAENEIQKLDSQYGQALVARDRTKLAIIQAGIAEANASLQLINQQLSRTELRSPLDGIVLEGDLTQSLGAPVSLGDHLITLAPDLDFRIILDIQEKHIGNVEIGQQGKIAFSSNPSKSYEIRIKRISPIAQVKEQNNIFEIEAEFTQPTDQQLRPGLKGIAKVHIDQRPLLQIYWQKLYGWARLAFWRWSGLA